MTEITKIPVSPFWPRHRARTHLIDPVAFGAALIAAPLMVAALGFWFLLIPVAALIMGGPLYLAFFTPVMLIRARRNEVTAADAGMVAVLTNAAVSGAITLLFMLNGAGDAGSILILYLGFGSVFSLIWGGLFGRLYTKWKRDYPAPVLA